MKVNLTNVLREQKTSQAGKPYTSLRIKCNEYGDQQLSGFGNAGNLNWKIGDTVEINVSENVSNGRTFLNFENPKEEKAPQGTVELNFLRHDVKETKDLVTRLCKHFGLLTAVETAYATPVEEPSFDNRDVPQIEESDQPW